MDVSDLCSHAAAPGTTASTANGLNQLAEHGAGTPTYDARGNLASEGGRTFMYSSENLLTGFAGHGRTMSWTWDPLMRVHHQTTSGANPRTYLFDGGNMILQNMNGAMLARYVYGPGQPAPAEAGEPLYSIDNQGRRAWFVADERGSILGETDAAGTLGMPRTYDEYGNASSLSYQHGYAGTLYLGLSRLYYNRARIYDPTLGRFLQTDPIGYGDGMNMYAYVGGDPVNATDPSGLIATEESENEEKEIVVIGVRIKGPREDAEVSVGQSVGYLDSFLRNSGSLALGTESDAGGPVVLTVSANQRQRQQRRPPPTPQQRRECAALVAVLSGAVVTAVLADLEVAFAAMGPAAGRGARLGRAGGTPGAVVGTFIGTLMGYATYRAEMDARVREICRGL